MEINSSPTVLPMARSDGWVGIAFTMNGEQHEAILDTGAKTDIFIPLDEARRLGLLDGGEENLNPLGQPLFWIKRSVLFSVGLNQYAARSALAGSLEHVNRHGAHVGYLLGQDFILRHKTEFDFSTGRVRFYPLDSLPRFPYRDATPLSYHLGNQYMLIHSKLGQVEGWFVWDTGAPVTLVFHATFQRAYPDLVPKLKWKVKQAAFMGGTKIANLSLRSLDMSDVQKSMEGGEGTGLLGLLGADIFGASRLLIDPQEKFIWRV